MPSPRRLARAFVPLAVLLSAGSAQAASTPRLAVGPDGTAHAVWSQPDGDYSLGQWNTRGADGVVGEAEYFTPGGAPTVFHDVAAGPDGRAVAVWLSIEPGGGVVKLRRRAADGSFSAPQTVSGPSAAGVPQVAMDADGDAVVAWNRTVDGKTVIEARRRAADGSLSSVKRLSAAAPTYSVGAPRLAVDPAGNAVVAWTVLAPSPYVQARRRAADGTLSATQNLAAAGGSSTSPQVGLDAGGNAVLAWRRAKDGAVKIQARRRSAAGTLSNVQDVSTPGTVPDELGLAVSPGGAATFTWHRPFETAAVVETRRRAPAGTLSPVELVSGAAGKNTGARVSVDGDGDAVFAWRREIDSSSQVQGRRRTAAGAWSPIDDISPAGNVGSIAVGSEPGGAAAFLWLDLATAPNAVQIRRRTTAGELSTINKLSY